MRTITSRRLLFSEESLALQALKYLEVEGMHLTHYGMGYKGICALSAALKVDFFSPASSPQALASHPVLILSPAQSPFDAGTLGVIAFEMKLLLRPLQINRTVTVLRLGDNHLKSDAVVKLVEAISGNSRITELDLSGNKIGHDGALAIAKLLKPKVGGTCPQRHPRMLPPPK